MAAEVVPAVPVLEEARRRGLLGPGPVVPHLHHALGFAVAAGGPPAGPAVDLGSGGGLPGLVLALVWPTSRWMLLDAGERRTAFLTEAVAELGLGDRVEVLRGRAEEVGRRTERRGGHRLVVARSFAPPGVTAECAAPLLAVGGRLVVSEPPEPDAGRWPDTGLEVLGLRAVAVVRDGGGTYQVLEQRSPCPERYPRRPGIPQKRPLF